MRPRIFTVEDGSGSKHLLEPFDASMRPRIFTVEEKKITEITVTDGELE